MIVDEIICLLRNLKVAYLIVDEMLYLLRNLQVAYLIVDEMHSEHPELVKVKFLYSPNIILDDPG